jgi:hypothetical protein
MVPDFDVDRPAEQRAPMLRALGCRNVGEADALGAYLRRLCLLVDEAPPNSLTTTT